MSRFSNPVPQFFLDDGELASSGRMYFFENKNYSLLKSTFSQPDNTVANTNPIKLDGQGRLPPCFGEGLYSVKLYAADPDNPNIDGELIWTRDDVDLSAGGDSAFSAWSPVQTYGTGSIVKDGEPYYRLYGSAASKGEQPSLNPSKWEKIVFITEHIVGRSYPDEYVVIKDGRLYASNVNGNVTTPPSASWDNLTFQDTTQDLSATGSGDFTGGTVLCTRIGRVVTISSSGNLSHSNLSSPSTAVGFIPSTYRPSIGATTVYFIRQTTAIIAMVNIRFDGILNVQYLDFAGNPVSATTTSSPFCISFNV